MRYPNNASGTACLPYRRRAYISTFAGRFGNISFYAAKAGFICFFGEWVNSLVSRYNVLFDSLAGTT